MTIKRALKRLSFSVFQQLQRMGIYVVPVHYYASIAPTVQLRRSKNIWNRPIDVSSIPMSLTGQTEVLHQWIAPYEPEYRRNDAYIDAVLERAGPGYGYIEAQLLYAMIRKLQPRHIIEVGSGVSTHVMLSAGCRNDRKPRITCIEPHPRSTLRAADVHLVERPVEQVALELFDVLERDDLLFIDSSHAVRPCGDVARIYLVILPRLKSGVVVHIHDVYLPYTFQRDVTDTYFHWMETALLSATLLHSSRYSVLLCASYLHYIAPDLLQKCFPEYRPEPNDGGLCSSRARRDGSEHFPSSIYLEVH